MTVMFLVKNSLAKKDCPDSTAHSFVAKIRGEVFAHFHPAACNFVHWLPKYASIIYI
jgi:hypothetical protein